MDLPGLFTSSFGLLSALLWSKTYLVAKSQLALNNHLQRKENDNRKVSRINHDIDICYQILHDLRYQESLGYQVLQEYKQCAKKFAQHDEEHRISDFQYLFIEIHRILIYTHINYQVVKDLQGSSREFLLKKIDTLFYFIASELHIYKEYDEIQDFLGKIDNLKGEDFEFIKTAYEYLESIEIFRDFTFD